MATRSNFTHTGNSGGYPVFTGEDDGNDVEITGGNPCTVYINGAQIAGEFQTIDEAIKHVMDTGATEIYRGLFNSPHVAEIIRGWDIPKDTPMQYEISPEDDGRGNTHSLTITEGESVLCIAAYPSEEQAQHDMDILTEKYYLLTKA